APMPAWRSGVAAGGQRPPRTAIRSRETVSLSRSSHYTPPCRQLHGYRCARHQRATIGWGDGTPPVVRSPATSPLDAVHAYAGPGTCAATLQIDDDAGATSLATLSVPVSTPIAVLQAIVADLDYPCIDSRDPDRHPRAVPAPRRFRVGLVQMRCASDPAANLDTAIDRVGQAARQGAQVICLPELFRSQYFCQREDHSTFDLAEPVPGPTTDALGRVAKEVGAVVIASVFERRAAGVY